MSESRILRAALPPPRLATLRPGLALVAILAGTFMVTLDFFIVNVAIPSLQTELGATPASLEWIVAGYGLTYAALLIVGGGLGDRHGRRRVFGIGLGVFTCASAVCGLAPNPALLILGRVVQGVGAAILAPQVLAILGTTHTGATRARAFAAYGLALGLAAALGQLIGGLLIAADVFGLGWRACFLVNLPIGVAAMLVAPVLLPESHADRGRRLDLSGAALLCAGITALLLPLIEGRAAGWPAWTWASLGAAAVLLLSFAGQQRQRARRNAAALVDPALWRAVRFRAGLFGVLALYGGVASFFFVLALYLQRGRGLDALGSGLVFTAMAGGFCLTSLRAAAIAQWWGRPTLTAGALIMAGGLAALRVIVGVGGTGGPIGGMLAALFVDGAGMGLVMAPLAGATLAGLPPQSAGAAAGVLASVQQFANAAGVALLGLVFFARLDAGAGPAAYAVGFDSALACLIGLALVLAVLVRRLER